MQIAQVLSGYSLGGADLLRRAMGKKIQSEMDAQRDQLRRGRGQERRRGRARLDRSSTRSAKFAGYGFNKCHAAAYALVAYQTAYLKANHPVEFFAASMTLDMGNADKLGNFRRELERLQIPLLPPDINTLDGRVRRRADGRGQARRPLRPGGDQGRRPRGHEPAGRGARGQAARSRTCSTSPSGSTSA